mmetsp:Transcript_28635/g.67281  ORF Transcript_28635/g.67281 Transcript_28635/m.67281 type:complete len:347 (-) Transcript_28635:70-1110(-)
MEMREKAMDGVVRLLVVLQCAIQDLQIVASYVFRTVLETGIPLQLLLLLVHGERVQLEAPVACDLQLLAGERFAHQRKIGPGDFELSGCVTDAFQLLNIEIGLDHLRKAVAANLELPGLVASLLQFLRQDVVTLHLPGAVVDNLQVLHSESSGKELFGAVSSLSKLLAGDLVLQVHRHETCLSKLGGIVANVPHLLGRVAQGTEARSCVVMLAQLLHTPEGGQIPLLLRRVCTGSLTSKAGDLLFPSKPPSSESRELLSDLRGELQHQLQTPCLECYEADTATWWTPRNAGDLVLPEHGVGQVPHCLVDEDQERLAIVDIQEAGRSGLPKGLRGGGKVTLSKLAAI